MKYILSRDHVDVLAQLAWARVLLAFDFDGKQVWARNLAKDFGKFSIMWIYGSSPVLHDGRLYVQVLQRVGVGEGLLDSLQVRLSLRH